MMMKPTSFVLCSMVTGILFIFFDMLIGIGTSPVFAPYSELAIWKTPPNVVAGVVFDLINGFILTAVYMTIYNGLPGLGWQKGLNYGLIVGLFRVLMTSFSSIVIYNIPVILVGTGLITGYVEIVLLCVILAVIYEKLP